MLFKVMVIQMMLMEYNFIQFIFLRLHLIIIKLVKELKNN
jgi:hypothetical protein